LSEAAVREAMAVQAKACRNLGSDFTGAVAGLLGERLDHTTALGRRVLGWPGDPSAYGDGLPLRLTGGLHALARSGKAPELAAVYPPNPAPDRDALWAILRQAIAEHDDALTAGLDTAPQTNEVGRSVMLMTALLVAAKDTGGLPFALYELGASAGLNLMLDRFAYDLGGLRTGVQGSAVALTPAWSGPPPPAAEVRVVERHGVDLAPLSVANPEHRQRLSAYVWPDQPVRLARVLAAIDIARGDPPRLEAGDAADWLETVLSPEPETRVVRVVMHTVAFQYFPAASQQRIREHIARVGAAATAEAPLAWIRVESDPAFEGRYSLRLTLWPDGADRVLGLAQPHGASFESML